MRWPIPLLLSALPALAGGTLDGRTVALNVLTYDDPAQPIFTSTGRRVVVGDGVEFGMGPEFRSDFLDVVPVVVDIRPTRVAFSYTEDGGTGQFWPAAFNGYVLRFSGGCALFEGFAIDRSQTTLPLDDDDVFAEDGALFVNVAGLDYEPGARVVVDLVVADCPMS
jgi:hypothetical protein